MPRRYARGLKVVDALGVETLVKSTLQRLLAQVEFTDGGHWLWTGATTGAGQPHAMMGGQTRPAARLVNVLTYGDLPRGVRVVRVCRRADCVAPKHHERQRVRGKPQRRPCRLVATESGALVAAGG